VLEKTALMNAGVAAFILTSADLKGKEMAKIFVNALPAISKTISKTLHCEDHQEWEGYSAG